MPDSNLTHTADNTVYDALIVGGGPAGTTAGLVLARQGLKVLLLEKDTHPRFHIGESILPRTELLLRELGLSDKIRALPHLPKFGAEFGFGNDFKTLRFGFTDGLLPGFPIFNIERAHLDRLLADEARAAGCEIRENTAVKRIVRLADNDVELETSAGTLRARVLIDASGHGTLVGRHLGTRRNMTDPELQKVAYFQHFEGVERLEGQAAGHPGIIMCEEGWFWLIGLSDTKTSVGFVTRPGFVKQLDVPPDRLLQWAIARCPVVRHRMRNAVGPDKNHVLADFSYTCAPHAGPGYFMVGDAGCFLDPIFSTGVTLAMMGANETGKHVGAVLAGQTSWSVARKQYIRFIEGSTGVFWRLIKAYYRHSFRELFMNGSGPFQVHKAVISVLAGQVFPRPIWALRWRTWLFHQFVALQARVPLVPRRQSCSLLAETPIERTPIATPSLRPSLVTAGAGV